MLLFIGSQVSKQLATLTRLRAIWKPLAVKHASMLLKKRVDMCTAQDLEDAVVQHQRARTDVLSATRCVKKGTVFNGLGDHEPTSVLLAPGGRWLLHNTLSFKCGVLYVDLDDPEPHWQQLIPPRSHELERAWISMDREYDGSTPTFHITLETGVTSPGAPAADLWSSPPPPMNRQISVWKISPTF